MNKAQLLSDKQIVLGVCGVNTAHESAHLARKLRELGAQVDVVLGEQGEKFISPLTFEELTGRKVHRESTSPDEESRIEEIATKADMVVIAPASFSFIGRLASNLEDGGLNTLVASADQPVLLAPSMDPKLYSSQNVRKDLRSLRNRGLYLVEPSGEGEREERGIGLPLFPEAERIIARIDKILREDSLLEGKKVLVTAGPTRTPFSSDEEPGRNTRSSLGFELSQQARGMGAEVLLVSGPTEQIAPPGVGVVWTRTTEELEELLLKEITNHDLILMSASASDWEAQEVVGPFEEEKTKELDFELDRVPNVLRKLGKLKETGQFLVSVEPGPKAGETDPEEEIEENNLDAYFYRDEAEKPESLDPTTFSGSLLFKTGNKEEFRTRTGARLARSLLKELGKRFFPGSSGSDESR